MSHFVDCPGGDQHWGPVGAAGLAVFSEGGSGALLLQKRAAYTHQSGTWSVPGGALEPGEDVHAAALREAGEELSLDLAEFEILGEVVDTCPSEGCVWTYTTLVVAVPGRPAVAPGNWESEQLQWTERTELSLAAAGAGGPPLHAGLRRALSRIVALAS